MNTPNNHHHHHHVAVLAFPFGSHAAPLLSLTCRLATAAPNTTFSFLNTAKSNSFLFKSVSFHNIKRYNIDDGVPVGYVSTGRKQEDIELFLNVTPGNFKTVLETMQITCLITDAFLYFGADIAKEKSIPWVALWTAGASSLSAHLYTDLIRESFKEEEESLEFVPGMPEPLRVKDLPPEVLNNIGSIFSTMLHKMGQRITRSTSIVLNSFEELDQPVINNLKSEFQSCLTMGPFNLTSPTKPEDDPNGCVSWLQNQKPASVVYISFGTVTTLPPLEISALAEGLEESGVSFLWSIKETQKLHLPKGFVERTSERGMVVSWAPQAEILQHEATAVFVTHCGWNSVLESITGGVPMICRPFFGDQKLNARLVSKDWRIGVVAGVLSRDGVKESLDLIFKKEDGEKMRKRVLELKRDAEQAVGKDGSSTKNFETLVKMVCDT